MRFIRTWKGTHFLGARTTLTQFRASWRTEKVIFPNLKGDAFSGRQNNPDAISSVMATWRSDFSKLERNYFFRWKGDFSEPEKRRFLWAPEQPSRNFERHGDQKKRFFRTWKKQLFQQKRRFFESERGRLFRALEQPWRNFERLGDLKKRFFEIVK